MRHRPFKLVLAALLALVLHAALLLLGAPRLEGLAATPPDAAMGPAPLNPAADSAQVADTQKPLDVSWDAPVEEARAELSRAVIAKPLPAPKPLPPVALLPTTQTPAPVAIKPLPRVAASSGGTGTAVVAAESGYANLVRQHLARYAGALPPGASGEARVQFVVQPDGRVSEVRLVRESGHAGLDSIALNLPTMAQPLPLPGVNPQRLEVPVQAVATSP